MHILNNIKLYLNKKNISYSCKCLLVKRIKVKHFNFLCENRDNKVESGGVSPLVHDLGTK